MDERCKQYHSALSRCAELLDNMKDGDPITEVPDFLAAYLASQSQATRAVPEVVREAVEAAFEDRASWRTKIAAAVRALDCEAPSGTVSAPEEVRLKDAHAAVQRFKNDWYKVPYFADRVNKTTREAISMALSHIVNLDAVGGPLDLSDALRTTSGKGEAA